MTFILDALAFIFDPTNWPGDRAIGIRLVEHIAQTLAAVGIGIAIAVPLGLLIGHTGRGRRAIVVVTNAARALPTFGLLLFLVLVFGFGLRLPVLLAVLVVMAVPPILAGVYAGIESIDRTTITAARAVGMTEWQILTRVEIPLALPLMVGGLRSATLQVIATATIAGYISLGGLGRFLIEGLALRDYTLAVVGAILVGALALAADGLLAVVQRLVVPRGVPRGSTGTIRTISRRSSRPTGSRAPVTEG